MLYPIFHEGVLRLYVISLSIIVIISYLEGFFDQFIKAAVAIISCAFDIIFGQIFLGCVSRTRDAIAFHITDPYHAFVSRIPRAFKALFFTLLGYSIFVLDHLYNTKYFRR
jgi:Na+-transporting NADH:ubiquinone oxidoreductase subunit NqrD